MQQNNQTQPTHNGVSPLSFYLFMKRYVRNVFMALILILFSLGIGMVGYHHFEKMTWVDAYVNAAMILSGMGPVSTLATEEGKLFAGTYALFSGIIFLFVMAVLLAPAFRHFLLKFHLELPKSN